MARRARMLIDEFLPEYDARSVHSRFVAASPESVYAALLSLDLRPSLVTRCLFRLRGMPRSALTLTGLRQLGFRMLGTVENEELLLGLIGRFWTRRGDLQPFDAGSFREFNTRRYAKAVWNLAIAPQEDGVELSTETRILCLDSWSRQRFRVYWTLIAPFSARIRMEVLRVVKEKAEADAGVHTGIAKSEP